MGQKFAVSGGGLEGENIKDECLYFPRKLILTETRHPVQKYGYAPKTVFTRAWQ